MNGNTQQIIINDDVHTTAFVYLDNYQGEAEGVKTLVIKQSSGRVHLDVKALPALIGALQQISDISETSR